MSDLYRRSADELDIMRLLSRLAQAVDDYDVDRYRSCLADEIRCPFGAEGTMTMVASDAYARNAVETSRFMDWVHHRLCNFDIEINGDVATAKVDVVVEMGVTSAEGTQEQLSVGGRYDLEFGRFEEGWRVTMRVMRTRYMIGNPKIMERAQQVQSSPP